MSVRFQYASNIIVAEGNRPMFSQDYLAYEQGTLDALLEIMKNSWTGYGLIQVIRELNGKEIVITPNHSKMCNAFAKKPFWKSNNQVEIVYNPTIFGTNSCSGPGFRADEFLMHELVHAYRKLRLGIQVNASVYVPSFHYTDFEEFAAILYVNIYSSAKKRSPLRKDHIDSTALPEIFSTSRGFFHNEKHHAKAVHDLIRQDYYLTQSFVRQDNGRFNPIDYFFRNSDECVKMIVEPEPMVGF
ncbi:hypothetical protein [Dyadobacter arcticus]|uniref:Uncharacterized protein n=1 Tax=Dyadobacter arcticus TaxID=1078754 RepID=A0ABX0UGH2_9BACT|nr:hypothetical protein [Dyadobacter arcticus]NIJ51144.1 hypothetical protein [Dyadobacter arcticus]